MAKLTVTPLPQALGATVEGLDLSAGISSSVAGELHEAWYEHLVLFFPELFPTDGQLIELGSAFGDLAAIAKKRSESEVDRQVVGPNGEIVIIEGAVGADVWHTDGTWEEHPPIGTLLTMKECPPQGGDTMWSNQYAAYEALSPGVRALVDGLEAVHGRELQKTGLATHPLVLKHPRTGRRALYVNRDKTKSINGLSDIESESLLQLLFRHSERPEFQMRWRWHAGDAAIHDNRVTMHYAVYDYGDARRVLHRTTIYERQGTE